MRRRTLPCCISNTYPSQQLRRTRHLLTASPRTSVITSDSNESARMSTAVEQRLFELWETPKTLKGLLSTVDHKQIGKRYIATAMVFLLIGGIEALIMRIQLARPDQSILGPETYNQIFTMHGMTMIFWYASPILSGFGVYLVPLMI